MAHSDRGPPRGHSARNPEDAVEHRTVVMGGPAGARGVREKQRGQPLPLLIRQFMSSDRTHGPRGAPLDQQSLVS